MNIFKTLLFFCLSTLIISCSPAVQKMGDFELLPLPQQFEITGVSNLKPKDLNWYHAESGEQLPFLKGALEELEAQDNKAEAQIVFSLQEALDVEPEGYKLNISDNQITIIGKDEQGVFYGFKTLEQLVIDAEEQQVNLPICSITDQPELGYRAIHWDVKHHMEKKVYYYDLIDKLASYKVNAVIVEIEDKLKYKRQPKVGSSDAWSIEEWKELSDYAAKQHIRISPLVQGLGHASFILKHDEYKVLRDDPKSDWAFNPLDPKTYEVQFDLYLDAMEAFPHGKYLHVGGDEVHTTGRNSGKSTLELQLGWLGQVCNFAAKHDRTPIFWDDMPLKQAKVYRPMFQPKMKKQTVDLSLIHI